MEHSHRLIRVGYGGTDERVDGAERVRYFLIKGDLTIVASQSHHNSAEVERNLHIAQGITTLQGYRAPWGPANELRQFRSEIESAMSDGPGRFRLTPAESRSSRGQPTGRGVFNRLFRRF
ncbi:MAG TPA: hypothetical protein VHY57_10445 [Rhizomicrobium sp.]|nr:hypothetical protein [Rhizomicrobium sp.]